MKSFRDLQFSNLRSGVLFSEERESIAARESAGLEKGEKRTPDIITARVVCHPLFVTLPSIMSQTSQETSAIFQRGQKVTLLVRDWRISIHFACFCFWISVTIMIDGSVKRNRKFGFTSEFACY